LMKMRSIRMRQTRLQRAPIAAHFGLRYGTPGKGEAIRRQQQERTLSKIARRQFIALSAVAAAGYLLRPESDAHAQEDMPHLSEDDPMAKSMKYTHDSSTVDPSARANPAENQHCANCALVQGEDGQQWRPCQIFPGKLVNANGWCSVWSPRA